MTDLDDDKNDNSNDRRERRKLLLNQVWKHGHIDGDGNNNTTVQQEETGFLDSLRMHMHRHHWSGRLRRFILLISLCIGSLSLFAEYGMRGFGGSRLAVNVNSTTSNATPAIHSGTKSPSNTESTPRGVVSGSPTARPGTASVTAGPTTRPSNSPTGRPSASPVTGMPTGTPTGSPTANPTAPPTGAPTDKPSASLVTGMPTGSPTGTPTDLPTSSTTGSPTASPTASPTGTPTVNPTNTNTAKKDCSDLQHFPEALMEFTKILHDDPEAKAFPTWNWTGDYQWQFEGLSSKLLQKAFGGKKVVFVGDSTLMFFTQWLGVFLSEYNATQRDEFIMKQSSWLLSKANPVMGRLVSTKADGRVPARGNFTYKAEDRLSIDLTKTETNDPSTINDSSSSRIPYHAQWSGVHLLAGEMACNFTETWATVLPEKPDILVANFGIHWLMLEDARTVLICFAQRWLHYEDWLEEIYQNAQKAGVKLLLYKTTNFICQKKYTGEYKTAVDRYSQLRLQDVSAMEHDNTTENLFHSCMGRYRENAVANGISETELWRYCTEGTFDDFGTQALNNRVFKFVLKKMKQQQQQRDFTKVFPRISVLNDHDLDNCDYTGQSDGRHYKELNLLRIRYLANMIQTLDSDKQWCSLEADRKRIESLLQSHTQGI